MDIIFATTNMGKMQEIQAILSTPTTRVLSMAEAGITIDVVEDGQTFSENAIKKAVEIMEVCHKLVLADDSGLEIDVLDKKPGVLSARFLGVDTPYAVKNQQILTMMEGVQQRSARFVCVIAAAFPDGKVLTTHGVLEGTIAYAPAGTGGFGYDPIFFVPEYGMTTGEMNPQQKNAISHRGQALEKMKKELEVYLEGTDF